ncbi:MAG: cytochrome-c peroxidase [Gemmatimonadota bacterium]|nr:cytochrome-c peroxidase [Gemmatimonadota bacterium]
MDTRRKRRQVGARTGLVMVAMTLAIAGISCHTPAESMEPEFPEIPVSLVLPEEPYDYAGVAIPRHYRVNAFPPEFSHQRAAIDLDNTPADNPVTNYGARLGRVLFYDTSLSSNGDVACATCHVVDLSFTDGMRFSVGVGGSTRRTAMSLLNIRFYRQDRFFRDERAPSLEEQALMPIQDLLEMGLTLDRLVSIVESKNYYPQLFEDAFGDDTVTPERIARALAQFQRSIVTAGANYDRGRAHVDSPLDPFPNFSDEENLGKSLFMDPGTRPVACANCHITEAFVTRAPANNGLGPGLRPDAGVAEVTGNPEDEGKFKAPSLRNIAIWPPYMHDGRFGTLLQVVEHYSSGIQDHPNLHPLLRDEHGEPFQFNFTDEEKVALVRFLMTLTDFRVIDDRRYQNPFRRGIS